MKTQTTLRKRNQKVPCRIPGCLKGPFKSAHAEAIHFSLAHSGRLQGGNGHSDPKADLGRNRLAAATPAEPPVRRKYRKRRKNLNLPAAEVEIMFCPSCLTDLHGVAVGMVMAKAKTKVNGCPNCGLDLSTVAAGMMLHGSGKA